MKTLEGAVALITGSSSGIGEAAARSLAKRKALIILTAIIIIYMFYWAFTRGPSPAADKSRTHSTRLELRDTLSAERLS